MNYQEKTKIDISEKGKRIYLASPYTHQDKKVMDLRYRLACQATAKLFNQGYLVFSPIVHCHPVAEAHNLPRDFHFWREYNYSFLAYWAETINVLCLPDWKHSIGVEVELAIAQRAKLPVYYI